MKHVHGVLKTIASIQACMLLSAASCRAIAEELVVSGAASLNNAFTEIGKRYEEDHPGSKVSFNFGASGALLQQIATGAPADVLATADLETMDRAERENLLVTGTRRNFARNRLVVVVPESSASSLSRLEDLRGPGIARIGIGTPDSVPAGRYAKEALEAAGLWQTLVSKYIFGQNVRQVLDYVARAEVDAGFVYATDAELFKGKVKVACEAPLERPVLYPIAIVQGTQRQALARDFLTYVTSESGLRVLRKYGFSPP